jgi:gamma-D-glutamyl-L-lysine dipeptidyl-peptidase
MYSIFKTSDFRNNKLLYFVIVLATFLNIGCKSREESNISYKDLEPVIKKWVPDSREGLCEIKIQKGAGGIYVIKGETNIPEAKSDLLNYFAERKIDITDSVRILPDTTILKKTFALVTVSTSNIKANPSHSSELVSQAVMGTPLKLLKKQGEWLLIQTPDYYLGWIHESGIVQLAEIELTAWKKSQRLIFTSKLDDIISPDNDKSIVSDIVAGSVLQYSGKKGEYYYVILPDGRSGRVKISEAADFKDWCSSVKPDPVKMISFARSLNGIPYLWGGTSVKAFDCSGYVKTIFFTGGIILARDASLQFRHGTQIDISSSLKNLIPGDLVFFGRLVNGEKRITHVGLYIGDNEVIHASGMVRISSLDSTRGNFNRHIWETMMGARRIIGTGYVRGDELVTTNKSYN